MSTNPKNPDPKPRGSSEEPVERTPLNVTLPPRDHQPTKAESNQEYDMPGADIVTVRRAFFQRIRVREEPPEGC